MLKKLIYFVLFLAVVGGGYYYLHDNEKVKEYYQDYFNQTSFHTLEIRYSAQGIMQEHQHELLKDSYHTFATPELHFYPYLLLEVKYTRKNNTTAEGVMLWDLRDGEMVTSTVTWEKSHGFEDCINARVDQHDFKIINTLASSGGHLSRKDLSDQIHVDADILDYWLESCHKKKLIVKNGNNFRLHFQKPLIAIVPETTLGHSLVAQTIKNAKQSAKKYSQKQIERIAHLAFGTDFTIRKSTEIFLPVYKIDILNPDGSVLSTYWNALTGQQMSNLDTIL